MNSNGKRPIVLAFVGPNGSGKTTVSSTLTKIGVYVNADDIRREHDLTDLDAVKKADEIRKYLLANKQSFTFETVLSTDRNLKLLKKAKETGYEIQCIYLMTVSPDINAKRVKSRVASGGHDVLVDKIYSRYHS